MVPLLSRISLRDYFKFFICLGIIYVELILRFLLGIFPSSFLDYLRFKLIHKWPRLFNGFSDGVKVNDSVVELDTRSLVVQRGYPFQEHTVVTNDGYILGLHRIPHGRNETEEHITEPRPVVFFMHGFMMNSEVWVCMDEHEKCLPFVLSDLGYDVWLGNNRGNKYSYKHVRLKPQDALFWDFAIDEFAMIDIPTNVQYILELTKQASLSYVGFSQGTAQMFASLSLNVDLNKKVNMFIALAGIAKPVGKIKRIKENAGLTNQLVSMMIQSSPDLVYLFFGKKRMLPVVIFWQNLLQRQIFSNLIDYFVKLLFNWKTLNISNRDKLVCYSHLYSYSSVKTVVHWFQIVRNGRFQMYDESEEIFGVGHVSPAFPVSQIKTPIALFVGGQDTLVDDEFMRRELPLLFYKNIPHYEHLDHLWANDVSDQVHRDVINILQNNKVK